MNETLQERRERRKLFFRNTMCRKHGVEGGDEIIKLMEQHPIRNCALECMYTLDFDKQINQ